MITSSSAEERWFVVQKIGELTVHFMPVVAKTTGIIPFRDYSGLGTEQDSSRASMRISDVHSTKRMRHSSTIAFSRRSTHQRSQSVKKRGKIKEKRLLMMDVMADANC